MASAARERAAEAGGADPRTGPGSRSRRARADAAGGGAAPRKAGGPSAERLLAAYASGIIPAADPGRETPDPCAILPLDGLRVSGKLAKLVRSRRFEIHTDTAFGAVLEGCAEPGPDRREVWLDAPLIRAYRDLHARGLAHSVEAWRNGALVGGLYGVSLGAAFFGESMFHRPQAGGSGASKVCLVALVERLRSGGFELLDVQYLTPHLESLGCVEIPRADYLERLERALRRRAVWAG